MIFPTHSSLPEKNASSQRLTDLATAAIENALLTVDGDFPEILPKQIKLFQSYDLT